MGGLHPAAFYAEASLSRLSQLLQEQRPRFATPSLPEAQGHLRAQNGSIALKVREPSLFRGYHEGHLPPLRSIGLTLGCIDAARGYELSFRSGDEMLVSIPLRGNGWVDGGGATVEMRAGQVLLVGPSCEVTKHWDGPGQVLSLHVPLQALESAMRGPQPQPMPLYLPPIALLDHDRMHTLLAYVELLVRDAHGGGGPLGDPSVAAHAEGLLLALLIEGLKPSLALPSDAPVATAVPYHVRRAERHMHAQLDRELDIDALAQVAGVSARTLQYGFRKAYGQTPMQRLKQLRLQRAREALADTRSRSVRIADLALSVGYANLSQFCRDYRTQFGETPTQTSAHGDRLCKAARACGDCRHAPSG